MSTKNSLYVLKAGAVPTTGRVKKLALWTDCNGFLLLKKTEAKEKGNKVSFSRTYLIEELTKQRFDTIAEEAKKYLSKIKVKTISFFKNEYSLFAL